MFTRQYIMRLLLIVGLVPAIAAAGLPPSACGCVSAGAQAGCACCSGGNSCCGEGECHCCDAGPADSGESEPATCCESPENGVLDKQANGQSTFATCRCGHGSVPQPAVPAAPSFELASPLDLPTNASVTVPSPPAVNEAAARTLVAQLPSADLPTTLCTLLI